MKKFNQVKIVLFDSTMAQFKLSVEALFTRGRPDGTFANLAYITDRGIANLNPSIYLVFSYKGDSYESTKNLYTSYPQLFKIRSALEIVKDLLVNEKGFIKIENVLAVRPEYTEPTVVGSIGKNNKWISFRLAAIDSTNEDMPGKIAGVTIEISDSEYASVLTAEEFLTIYSIVKDLDLATIQVQLSTLFIMGEYDIQTMQPVYPQPAYQYAPQPQYIPQQPGYTQQPQKQRAPQPQRQQPAPRYGNTPIQQRPAPQVRPAPQTETPQHDPSQSLQPRKEKPIVNMQSVEETPVSAVSFEDNDAIDEIFNDDEN